MYGLLLILIENLLVGRNNTSAPVNKQMFEKRLGELIDPTKSSTSMHKSSLKVIDHFIDQNNTNTNIKQIIQTVKPYFLMMLQDKLEQESQRVLKAFRAEHIMSPAMELYLLHLNYPEFMKNSEFIQKINDPYYGHERLRNLKKFTDFEESKEYQDREARLEYGSGNIDAEDNVNSEGLSAQ